MPPRLGCPATKAGCQPLHLARLSCSQIGPRCRRGAATSGRQHRAATRCSGGMVSPVRSARVRSATIAHASRHRHRSPARCFRRHGRSSSSGSVCRPFKPISAIGSDPLCTPLVLGDRTALPSFYLAASGCRSNSPPDVAKHRLAALQIERDNSVGGDVSLSRSP
jgi:hypothetical protein